MAEVTTKQPISGSVALGGDDTGEIPYNSPQLRLRLVRSTGAIEIDKQKADSNQNIDFLLKAYRLHLKENREDQTS